MTDTHAAAVQIADDALDTVPFDDAAPGERAEAVVAALAREYEFCPLGTTAELAALRAVAWNARDYRYITKSQVPRYASGEALDAALDALPATGGPAVPPGEGYDCYCGPNGGPHRHVVPAGPQPAGETDDR